jgi:uncharacterized protein (TIGR02284 family)
VDQEHLDTLKTLYTNEINARMGYEEALVDAEGQGVSSLFLDMVALHDGNARDLAGLLIGNGETADDDGSFMSVVNRALMSLRGLFDGLDEGVLPSLIESERRNLDAYDEAMRTMPERMAEILAAQREKIAGKIAQMEMRRAA